MDECRRSGHGFDVIAFEYELILLCGRVDTTDPLLHFNSSDILFPQKVTDFDHRIVLTGGHINGEVSVDCPHLILISFGDPHYHVLDVRTNGPNCSQLFTISEPLLDSKSVFTDQFHI